MNPSETGNLTVLYTSEDFALEECLISVSIRRRRPTMPNSTNHVQNLLLCCTSAPLLNFSEELVNPELMLLKQGITTLLFSSLPR
jgi:hypothetical protein